MTEQEVDDLFSRIVLSMEEEDQNEMRELLAPVRIRIEAANSFLQSVEEDSVKDMARLYVDIDLWTEFQEAFEEQDL